MPGLNAIQPTCVPPTTASIGLQRLARRQTASAPAPLHHSDRLETGLIGARTASTIGETTLRLMRETGVHTPTTTAPVGWVTVAGFADGMALSTEDSRLQTACMLAGHYGGYRFGLAAPLLDRTSGLIAVSGVTAAAIVPQLLAQDLSDPAHVAAPVAPNTKATHRAGFVGGTVGAGLAMTTVLTHSSLMRPQAAIPLVALGAASGYLDGVAAVTNQRKAQALSTGAGHVVGFAMAAAVPGVTTAARTGLTRAGLASVALTPFVVASLDAIRHGQQG
jgi:hypothetical protein